MYCDECQTISFDDDVCDECGAMLFEEPMCGVTYEPFEEDE